MGAAGAFYVQVFQYIDPGIAYGPATSVEALVGGHRRRHGHAVGAGARRGGAARCWPTSRATCSASCPGINMVIYGVVLVLIVMFRRAASRASACRCGSCWTGKGGAWLSPCCRCAGCRTPSAA